MQMERGGIPIRLRRGAVALAAVLVTAPLALAGTADRPDPYAKANGTWISIGGMVENVRADAFTLDYGDGRIEVEMDDGDRDADAYRLVAGDAVTVHGRIDDDFFEQTTIEASSVYVEKLGTHFWASAADEEDRIFVAAVVPVGLSATVVQGTVTRVGESEFVLDVGPRSVTIDVSGMSYDPLDDEGYQKIRVGDVVRATGEMDHDLLEGREFQAESVVTLHHG